MEIKKDSTSQYNVRYVNQNLLKYISRRQEREERARLDGEGKNGRIEKKEEDRGRRSQQKKVNKNVGEKERSEVWD